MKRISILLAVLLLLNLAACGETPDAQSSGKESVNSDILASTQAEWWTYDETTLASGFNDYYAYSDDLFYYITAAGDQRNFVKMNVQDQSTVSFSWDVRSRYPNALLSEICAADFSEDNIWVAVEVLDEDETMTSTIYQLNWSGAVLSTLELSADMLGNPDASDVTVSNLLMLDENRIIFSVGTQCFLMDEANIQEISNGYWIEDLLMDGTGEIYAVLADETQSICPIDLNAMEVKAPVFQCDAFGGRYCGSADRGIAHIYSDKICRISTLDGSGEESTLVDFSQNAITSSSIAAAWILDEDTVLVVSSDMISGLLELNKLIRTSEDPSSGKTVLYLGDCTQGELSLFAQNAISAFNKTSSDYMIQVQEYADATSLDLAMVSGEGPDIICLGGLDENKLIANGLLLDLYSGLQANGIEKTDLVEAYRNCYEVDGKLYSIATEFQYMTMAFCDSSLADCSSWSLSQLERYSEEISDDMTVFGGFNRDTFLSFYLSCRLDQFVDWDNTQCSFDRESFLELLKLCKSLGDTVSDGVSASGEIYEHIFSQMRFADFYSVQEAYTYAFPTIAAGGLLTTNENSTFGINATSTNADAAFQFLALLLDENTQNYVYDGFPVLSSAFEEQYHTALENGALSPELVYAGICQATDHVQTDEAILAIVQEEAEAFFHGDKSAEAVADLVQSRVEIYIAEQR
jgi:ABC-type glycerol-3-phosphate transport system substrate-binding protein